MSADRIVADLANISLKTNMELTRREFLKTAGGGILALIAASCGIDPNSPVLDPNSSEITPTAAPTLEEQNVLSGTGEFTNGDASLPTSLKELLSKSFNIEIPIEAATPFSVEIGGTKFDFVSLAPLENKELNISWDEKLFIRVDNTLADLDRKVVNIDNKNLVLWSYLNTGTPEPVLWYPSLTNEAWQNMTPEQKKDFYAGFAPPSPLESKIPGFTRSSNKMFAISFAGLPDGAQKVLASLAQPLEATTTVVESPLPAEMTDRYLAKFDKTEEGTKVVDGVETKVIFGVKEGKDNKVIAMEIDGRMTRVGETTDANGNSFYVYMNPNYSIGNRIAVTDITADVLFGTGDSKADVNLFKSIGTQFGLTPEEMKAKIMENDGKIKFQVAVGNGEGSANNFKNKFAELPNKADFNKPIEIITVATNAELAKLTKEFEDNGINLTDLLVTVRGLDPAYPLQHSNLLWVKPNGQMQIIVIQTGIEITPGILDSTAKPEDRSAIIKYLALSVGGDILKSIQLINLTSRGNDALTYLMKNDQNKLGNIANKLFEYEASIN